MDSTPPEQTGKLVTDQIRQLHQQNRYLTGKLSAREAEIGGLESRVFDLSRRLEAREERVAALERRLVAGWTMTSLVWLALSLTLILNK